MNKKFAIVLSVCLLGALLFAGCARTNFTPSPSPTQSPATSPISSVAPIATPTNPLSPIASPSPTSAPLTGAGETDLDLAKRIEAEVDKLSEVKNTVALVSDKQAVIAVEFDDAYKGAMTSRIEEMIVERAKAVDSSLTKVSVSDDPAMLKDIKDLRDRVDGGNLLDDIRAEFDKLIQRLKPTA